MKQIISTLMVFAFWQLSAQQAMTFQQAEQNGIRISQLDSIYPSGLAADSTKAVFGTRQQEFVAAYQKTLQDLGRFLKSNQFSWEKQTRCFNRIYFSKEGKVDYFLYQFSKDAITPEKEKQFNVLLSRFIRDYRFPMTAATGFAQCSPVRYGE